MSGLIDTTEMYLKTVYELLEEDVAPLRARLAERLHHSGPTVSQTVSRMERDGLLAVHADRHIQLSDQGYAAAMSVMRRHRLVERLLVDVIGLDWALVHDEACRWEHVISDEVEARIAILLDHPDTSPYGNPIPPAEDPTRAFVGTFRQANAPLSEVLVAGEKAMAVQIVRIGERLQADPAALLALAETGLRPGADVTALLDTRRLLLAYGERECELDPVDADQVFVRT